MTGKVPLAQNQHNSSSSSHFGSTFIMSVWPWVICGLAAAFYCYEYLLRIIPGLMVPELQRAFSINGQFLDATKIGDLSWYYYRAYLPMQLAVGLFMDRYGPRWNLTLAVFCCALGTLLFATTDSLQIASLGRFATGFGSAFAFVGVLKLASAWLPANRFALISGLTTTLGMIGAMQGDIILGELIQTAGWQATLLYSSYIGFILVPIVWLVVRNSPPRQYGEHQSIQTQPSSHMSYTQLWVEIKLSMLNPQIWLNGVIGGLIMAPTMVFPELWGKLYLETVHEFTASDASRAATMIFLGWAVGGPLSGYLSDKIKRRRLPLLIGAGIVSALLLIFLYYPGLTLLQVEVLLFLIGFFSSVEVICFAVGRELCTPNLAGTVVAVTNFLIVCFSIFQVFTGSILDRTWDGVMVDAVRVYSVTSYHAAMLILPAATLLAFLLCFFLKETHCNPLTFPSKDLKNE